MGVFDASAIHKSSECQLIEGGFCVNLVLGIEKKVLLVRVLVFPTAHFVV